MAELEQLQLRDIPAGRQVLRDHHGNLHRVADYCESSYLQLQLEPWEPPSEGIPVPPLLPTLLGPFLAPEATIPPPPPPVAIIPPPPPLPGDLPPLGDLAVPPLDLMVPAPDGLELPPALPALEDMALPPPPATEDPPWTLQSSLEKVHALEPF